MIELCSTSIRVTSVTNKLSVSRGIPAIVASNPCKAGVFKTRNDIETCI